MTPGVFLGVLVIAPKQGFGVFLTVMITLFVVSKCKYCAGQGFKGCYGFSHSGIMLMGDDQVPMASVGVFYADGKGNLSGHWHRVNNIFRYDRL